MPEFPHTIDPNRTAPVLSQEVLRAMTLGRELHMWNTVRRNRAAIMQTEMFQFSSPAFHAAFLCGLAQIDRERRNLRALLSDALEAVGECRVEYDVPGFHVIDEMRLVSE